MNAESPAQLFSIKPSFDTEHVHAWKGILKLRKQKFLQQNLPEIYKMSFFHTCTLVAINGASALRCGHNLKFLRGLCGSFLEKWLNPYHEWIAGKDGLQNAGNPNILASV
jgi:hypothetical protein